MTEKGINRRRFFSTVVKTAGVFALAPVLVKLNQAQAQEKRRSAKPAAAGGGMPMLDPNDSVAKAVKYIEDAKKASDSKGNTCHNCGFYAKKETRDGKEVGTCTIFAGKLVKGEGWCASWNKKA